VAGGHRVHVKALSTGRPTAVEHAPIPGGYAAERVGGFGFQGFLRRKQGGRRARYRNRRGAVVDGRKSLASASTVRVETANTPAASATDEAPATSQIRSDGFEFALLEFRRFTICLFYQFATSASNCCQDRYEEILSKRARY